MRNALTWKHVAQYFKLRVVKRSVHPTLLHGAEAWTSNNKTGKKTKVLKCEYTQKKKECIPWTGKN